MIGAVLYLEVFRRLSFDTDHHTVVVGLEERGADSDGIRKDLYL